MGFTVLYSNISALILIVMNLHKHFSTGNSGIMIRHPVPGINFS